jgi:hypothetical protein
VHRWTRPALAAGLFLAACLVLARPPHAGFPVAHAGERADPTVSTRLSGWVGRRDAFWLYKPGVTVRARVRVEPHLREAKVRARLEWRRSGTRWRLLDVSTLDLSDAGRAMFLVKSIPAGYAFRIRAKVPAGRDHTTARSAWQYFRVR